MESLLEDAIDRRVRNQPKLSSSVEHRIEIDLQLRLFDIFDIQGDDGKSIEAKL
jgi:hypothetical protein